MVLADDFNMQKWGYIIMWQFVMNTRSKVWLTTNEGVGFEVIPVSRLWEGVAVIGLEVNNVFVGDIVEKGEIVGIVDGEDVGTQSEAQKGPSWSTGVSWYLQPELVNTLDA